jgi:hypothetical protein
LHNIYTSIKLNKKDELELDYEQISHSDGFLPLGFAGIGALGALLGGAAAIANSFIDAEHKKAEKEEIQRHKREVEKKLKTLSLSSRSLLKKKKSRNLTTF